MPLPISKAQAIKSITWLKTNFGNQLKNAVKNTPFTVDTLCGIACQETANVWVFWVDKKTPEEILKLCVFDASGDYPGTQRSAFPKNAAAFRARYGDAFTDVLIAEANLSRKARGLGAAQWLYKGYGIFQYDLQYVTTDRAFFEQKQWYNIDKCFEKLMKELKTKWNIYHDMFKTIKGYNGSGARAQEYANNVTIFISYSKEVVI
jgi:hypothetical protein